MHQTRIGLFILSLFAAVALLWVAPAASAQKSQARAGNAAREKADIGETNADEPPFHQYKGVRIGMSAEEVRKALGNPQEKSTEQDFYVFSEKETAQFFYDASQKVSALAVTYMGEGSGAPTAQAVFGSPVETKPDGSVYKMERFPKSGYWLSYSRVADAQMVSVTLKKID